MSQDRCPVTFGCDEMKHVTRQIGWRNENLEKTGFNKKTLRGGGDWAYEIKYGGNDFHSTCFSVGLASSINLHVKGRAV